MKGLDEGRLHSAVLVVPRRERRRDRLARKAAAKSLLAEAGVPIPSRFRFLDWYLTTGITERWDSYYVDEVVAVAGEAGDAEEDRPALEPAAGVCF